MWLLGVENGKRRTESFQFSVLRFPLFLDVGDEVEVEGKTHKGFGFPDLGDLVGEREADGQDVTLLEVAGEHLILAHVETC